MNSQIAFFCPTLELGGAERKTAILANAFAGRGYDVDICTTNGTGVVSQDIFPPVRIVDFNVSRVLAALGPLRRYLKERKPRVLICIQCHAGIAGVIANMLSRTRTPVIVVEQSLTLSRLREISTINYYKFRTLVQVFYPRAARVVAISNDVREDLLLHARIQACPIEVIHNPAAIPVLQDRMTSDSESLVGWPKSDAPIIATVGRLVPVKDIPTLMRAFAGLRAQQALKLVIIGDGPERENLERLAQKLAINADTYFLGPRNKPWRYLKQATIFVMSSRFEGFGNTLVEAMAVGCAVVSTNCPGGPSDILANGKYGPLVPVGDDSAMATAIANLLTHMPERQVLIQWAQQFGEPIIDAYLNLIGRVSGPQGVS